MLYENKDFPDKVIKIGLFLAVIKSGFLYLSNPYLSNPSS